MCCLWKDEIQLLDKTAAVLRGFDKPSNDSLWDEPFVGEVLYMMGSQQFPCPSRNFVVVIESFSDDNQIIFRKNLNGINQSH